MNVLITGGTGAVGSQVRRMLVQSGHSVWISTRDVHRAQRRQKFPAQFIPWGGANESLDLEKIPSLDGVIHLMGEPVADGRWSKERKQAMWDSRVKSTSQILNALKKHNHCPNFFIQASAIGYYGDRGGEILNEASERGNGFLAELCDAWEKSSVPSDGMNYRHVIIRIPLVLDKRSGLIEKLSPVFKMGLGGPLGSGSHWMSWAHMEDVARFILKCVFNPQASGIYLASTPNPVTNREFTKIFARQLRRPALLPVPKLVLTALLGELGQAMMTSQRCVGKKFNELGFEFLYPTLEMCLDKICHSE